MLAPATEKESLDRTSLLLTGVQMDLVKYLAKHCTTPLVLVLVNGGPIDVQWAIESPRVAAVLVSWYPGQIGSRGTGRKHGCDDVVLVPHWCARMWT